MSWNVIYMYLTYTIAGTTGITQGGGGKEKKKNSVERKGRIAKEKYVCIVPTFTSYRNYIPYRNSKVVVDKQHCHNNLVTTC